MKILFLIPYPIGESPSQRFRFEQYFSLLSGNGFSYTIQCFLNSPNWKIFFKSGHFLPKALSLINGFTNRLVLLFHASGYDFIFIHREAAPIGPPIFEWIIAKVLRKKIIYDFDDAIWLTDRNEESFLLRIVKWRSKVALICSWAYKVSCGNEYLCSFARKHNSNVLLNPTTVDTQNLHNPAIHVKKESYQKIVIGWTGSHSTLKYLDELFTVLQHLENKYSQVEYWIIADKPPVLKLSHLQFKLWSPKTEIDDLAQFDIGIMPLPNDQWANGKCGFKALQYMGLEIPTVASPVGVNSQIVEHGKNGLLCQTTEEWKKCLSELIENKSLRLAMGAAGRKKVIDHYSVSSNSSNFLSLFS